jgi:16S rRNA (adenine1518-N6/adenine1519-N6)-dimethyltransferase
MRARKRFGQHFLTDEAILQQMERVIGLRAADRVLEIGAGHGALTDLLIGAPSVYKAVEIDRDLVPLLRARHPSLEVINADILRVDLADVMDAGEPWRVIGNLPYNISSPLLSVLTEFTRQYPQRVADMHFMLQREMAERLAAQPGTKAWGRLSVMVQLQFDVELLFDVAPQSFNPPPRVWSSVIRMLPRNQIPAEVDVAVLDQIVRMAFAGRRKRLSNSLKALDIDWNHSTLDPGLRADNVTALEYLSLVPLVRMRTPSTPSTKVAD